MFRTKNIKLIIVLFICTTYCSCASILNSKQTNIRVITSDSSRLVINNDTLLGLNNDVTLKVNRNKKPISLTAFDQNSSKTITINSENSNAYYLNFYPSIHLWTGFLIDRNNPKRYSYPKLIYIDFENKDNVYLTKKPANFVSLAGKNILKITPLRILGALNPSAEFSYERVHGTSFSSQVMTSYLFPISLLDLGLDFKPKTKGFRVAFEEKFYYKKSAPIGPYIGLEFDFLKNKYHDYSSFIDKSILIDSSGIHKTYLDTFEVRKQLYSFNFKIGYQKIFNKITIDFYVGIGIRNRNVSHSERINPNDEMEKPRHPNIYYSNSVSGKNNTLSFPLNCKIGWMF
jgi:hypothetical protein